MSLAADTTVTTTYGTVAGERRPSGVVYRAIPYAAPMSGAARFAAPRPPLPWTGVRAAPPRPATAPCPHRPAIGTLDITPLIGPGWDRGEDAENYLTVNVWTPASAGADAPVLVFVHGGGFVSGSHTAEVLRGDAFLDSGVVLVTVAYRLGIPGWLAVPGAPANRGLLDVIAALRWVREEIRAFGGDPDRVTVAGQSAGAMIVAGLLASPAASGLFIRAISASGNAENAIAPEVAARVTAAVTELLGTRADATTLSKASDEHLVELARRIGGRDFGFPGRPSILPTPFALVLDPDSLPCQPTQAVLEGRGRPVDLLAGHTSEEANIYLVPTGVLDRAADPAGLARATTDALFVTATRRLADAHAAAGRGKAFSYEFTWRSNAFDGALGACHCVDLPWVFGTTDLPALHGPQALLGTALPAPEQVRRVHEAWIGFVRDGDPGWPRHTPTAPGRAVLP